MKKIFLFIIVLFNFVLFGKDGRIQYLTFETDEIFTVKASSGYITILEFAKSEKILSAATGFNKGWDIGVMGNVLHVRPVSFIASGESDTEIEPNNKEWRTNIYIKTTKRSYMGNLEVSENNNYQYRITFKYPQDEAEEAARIAAEEKARKKAEKERLKKIKNQERIKKELAKKTVPRNWNYVLKKNKNSTDIVPDYVYDDGTFTYFGFSKTKSFPTVFEKEEEGESLLNTHTQKNNNYNILVIHQLVKLVYLRKGEKLVAILNRGYGINPQYEYSDTINKNIKREIIQ